MKVGFLGLGWIGLNRLQAARSLSYVEVAGVADPDLEARRQALELAPGAFACRDLRELLELPLEAVVIATPSAAHAEQTLTCLEAGLPVFCQKPLARSGEEASQVIEAARRANLKLGVDLCYRHLQAFTALKRLIDDRELGRVFAVQLIFHNAYGPNKEWFYNKELSGGGCLIDLGTHLFDLVYWLLGPSMPSNVSCRLYKNGRPCLPGEVEDYASGSFEIDGCLLDFRCSWHLHAGRDAQIEVGVFGTQGGARVSNVGGSYYDFLAERFQGTSTQLLVEPPDDWTGLAVISFLQQLLQSKEYDSRIEDYMVLSRTIDWLYSCGQVALI